MARRPGKYDHITANLPKLPLVEAERRDIIELVKAEILSPPPEEVPEVNLADLLDQIDVRLKTILVREKRATGGRRYASEFARVYAELRWIKEHLTDWLSNVQLLVDAYEVLMVDQMEVEGVSSQRLTDGSSVSTHQEPYPQITDKEAFRVWCIKNGFEHDMHLWPSKTASLVKEMRMDGEPDPPGISVFAKTYIRLNKA